MSRKPIQLQGGEADVALQRSRVDGVEHRLTTIEAKLLAYLVGESPRDVSRTELLNQVWGYAAGTRTRAVDTAVKRLRAKIERDPKLPRHLVTVTGVGYRFEPTEAGEPPAPKRHGNCEDGVTRFVGREDELAALERGWEDEARLQSIVGPAGVGKTRLARRHGSLLAARGQLSGGAWFIDLSTSRVAEDVTAVIAACIGVRLSGDDEASQLGRALDRLGEALVVLDNYEHLADNAAHLLARLVAASERTRFLVTSRERLRIDVERSLLLRPLPVEPAMALFVDRAKGAAQAAQFDEAHIRTLVEQLDRLPLAIELAAGRLNLLSVRSLIGRLNEPDSDALEMLGHASRDSSRPTLRAALERSWELLTKIERQAFTQCSVFVGDFDLATAEAVLDVDDAVGALQSLCDKSVLSVNADGRLAMLRTIRTFARMRLSSPETEEAHADYFIRRHYRFEADLDLLAHDAPELEAITHRFAERDPSRAARAAVCVEPLVLATAPHALHRRLLAVGLQRAGDAGDTDAELRLRVAEAEARAAAGEVDAAVEMATRALLVAGDSTSGRLAATTTLANIERRRGAAPRANELYNQALTLAADETEPLWEARILRHMASLNTERGELGLARERFAAALDHYRRLGDRRAEAVVLGNLGNVYLELARDAEAVTHHELALSLLRPLGDRRREAMVLSNLAVVHHQRGALEESAATWRRSLEIHRSVANRRFEGFAQGGLGVLDFENGAMDDARRRIYQSVELAREAQDRRSEAIALARWGAVLAMADAAGAQRALDDAARTIPAVMPWWEAGLRVLRAFVSLGAGRVADATAVCDEPTVTVASSFQRISQRMLRAAIGRVESAPGR